MTVEACARIVERGDPDRFRATMAAPVAARAVLFPIYAFNVEVARAPWVTQEPMIAEMRLQWWRDALEEIAGPGTPRRHEVVDPLAGVLDAEAAGLLDGLVAARRWDIGTEAFADAAALDAYLDATSGHLLWVAARALGAEHPEPVRDLAYAAGVANLLAAVPELEAKGRKPLADGTTEGVRQLAERGLARLAAARRARRRVPASAVPALLAAWRAGPVLIRAARDPRRVAAGDLKGGDLADSLRLARLSFLGWWR